ncbi:hypothetical protein RFI_29435 [Reticulomyxa filosa]|uniref:C2H2-type domain-containing protein n=1 Tax=Reticulomyxa filosa TaxID=46433 RepID=X6M4J2_RETFI|nr:hypothetical protein RFI_29435 [Reticulomyxa filosa]|eukprot:ETO07955.1 hypothetical protein RFI_29435 [Reticulomyxa filosa]
MTYTADADSDTSQPPTSKTQMESNNLYLSSTPHNHEQNHHHLSNGNLTNAAVNSDSKVAVQIHMERGNENVAKTYALITDDDLGSKKDYYINVSNNVVLTKLGVTAKGGNYYVFDKVFNASSGIIQIVPEIVGPIVANALNGYSDMICLYGHHPIVNSSPSSPLAGGMIPPVLKYIVDKLKGCTQAASIVIKVSAMEYYGTNVSKIRVFDLLDTCNTQASSNHQKKGHSSINLSKLSYRVIGNSIDIENLLIDIKNASHLYPQNQEKNQTYGYQSIHGHTIYDIAICQNHINNGVQTLQMKSNIFLFDLVCELSSNIPFPFFNPNNQLHSRVENFFSLESSCNALMIKQFRDILKNYSKFKVNYRQQRGCSEWRKALLSCLTKTSNFSILFAINPAINAASHANDILQFAADISYVVIPHKEPSIITCNSSPSVALSTPALNSPNANMPNHGSELLQKTHHPIQAHSSDHVTVHAPQQALETNQYCRLIPDIMIPKVTTISQRVQGATDNLDTKEESIQPSQDTMSQHVEQIGGDQDPDEHRMQYINAESFNTQVARTRSNGDSEPQDNNANQYSSFQHSFEHDELFNDVVMPPPTPLIHPPAQSQPTQSTFQCPVFGCDSSLKTLAGLHLHVNGHIANHSKGQVPQTYFQAFGRVLCCRCNSSLPISVAVDNMHRKCHKEWTQQQEECRDNVSRLHRFSEHKSEEAVPWQLPTIEDIINMPAKIIGRVPKAARAAFASITAWVLRDIADNNDISAWTKWVSLTRLILWDPGRGGTKHANSIANSVINRTKLWREGNIKKLWDDFCEHSLALPTPGKPRPTKVSSIARTNTTHAKAIKLAALGELSKAFKALTPSQTVSYNDDTIKQLRDKHPYEPLPAPILQAIDRDERSHRIPPILPMEPISTDEITTYIRRLGRTSAGGVDLFAAQHLMDIAPYEFESGTLTSWAKVITLIIKGTVCSDATPVAYGARLIGISKPDGSPRPIAIGSLLRRSAGTILMKRHAERIKTIVGHNQFGINVKAGIELFVHGFKAILQHIRPMQDAVAIKVDFKNAFNSCKRAKVLQLIRSQIPELYDDVYHAAYHDDLTMASLSSASLTLALTSLEALKESHGIEINYSKTEWLSNLATPPPSQFIGITHNTTYDTTLVSIPIGKVSYIHHEMEDRQKEWSSQFDKIMALRHSQTMLLMLRNSMQLSKVNYFIRSNFAGYGSGWIKKFDDKMKQTMETITAHPITDQQWTQCQLPIRQGGLGLKTALPYAGAAFIASALTASRVLPSIHKTFQNVNWTSSTEMDNAIHHYNSRTPDHDNIIDLNILPEQAFLSKSISKDIRRRNFKH